MNDTLRLGRVLGIPVGVNWSIVVVALAVVALLSAQILPSLYPDAGLLARVAAACFGAFLFFASLLGHELGHAVVARRHEVGVAGITLWLLGAVAKLTRQAPTPKAEFRIAIAGPAVSFIIGIAFGGAAIGLSKWTESTLPPAVLAWLAAVNLLLAISNLLPGAPLDGGRVLTAILWKRVGNAERARLLSARSGFVLGIVLAALGLLQATRLQQPSGWWTVVIGYFILTAARAEIMGAAVRHRLSVAHAGDLMRAHPLAISDSLTIDQALHPREAAALPVIRWNLEPVGYLSSTMTAEMAPADRSWTTVSDVMQQVGDVPRAWSNETIQTIVERAAGVVDHVTVIHNPQTGDPIGTLSRAQVDHLFATPTFWGRLRPQQQPPANELVLGGDFTR